MKLTPEQQTLLFGIAIDIGNYMSGIDGIPAELIEAINKRIHAYDQRQSEVLKVYRDLHRDWVSLESKHKSN